MVQADAGIITATPFANVFVVAFEQAGQVWIVDLEKTDTLVTTITGVGRHLHDGFLSHDGRVLVVFSYDDHHNAVIDLAEARVVRKIPAGCQPHLGGRARLGTRTSASTPLAATTSMSAHATAATAAWARRVAGS